MREKLMDALKVAMKAKESGRVSTIRMVQAAIKDLEIANRTKPNAWLEIAEERLEELERELVRAGWTRLPGGGPHWWSRRYTRTTGEEPRSA